MKLRKVLRTLVALTLTCTMMVTPVFAAPENNQESLETQKAAAQSEASALQLQLNSLIEKMNDLELQLIAKGQEIIQAEEDLRVAEEKEKQQYEDLKLRIKYMYEEGEGSALERVMTSGSIAEVLAQAEYVEKVHSYDREQLEVYQDTVQEVKDLKSSLETEQANLEEIEGQYETQKTELSSTLESKNAEVANLDAMIQEAARLAAEKAAEEQRKAAEAAAAAAAAAQQNNNNNNANNNTADTGNSSAVDNGNGTVSDPVAPSAPEPNYDVVTGNAIVDRAYGWVGRAEYVWGACSPGAFDCSGFVSYCLTGSYSRLGTTYTFLGWPRVSDPQPGDVAVNEGHCGIYIGGGQMIHAATYGVGVVVGPVQSGMVYVRY